MLAPPMFSMGTSQRGMIWEALFNNLGDGMRHETKYFTPGPGTYPIKDEEPTKIHSPTWK